jgi:ABC-2 type transport system permease protein
LQIEGDQHSGGIFNPWKLSLRAFEPMKTTLTLTAIRMRLALRTKVFLFFSLIMPLAFLFLYAGVFAKGEPPAVRYMLPAVMALTVMGSFWGMSVQLVLFREQGILRRFRLATIGAAPMLASGILSNFLLTMPTIFVQLLLARWLFKVEHFGNLADALVFVSLGAMTFAAMGLIVASVTNSMQETQLICNAVWFILLFLSGATVPLPTLPKFIQQFALFLPATYLIDGLHRLFNGAHVWQLGGELLTLGASLAVSFFVSVQMFRWEQEEKILGRAKLKAVLAVLPFLLIGAYENAYGHRLQRAREILQQVGAQQRPQPQQQPSNLPAEPR